MKRNASLVGAAIACILALGVALMVHHHHRQAQAASAKHAIQSTMRQMLTARVAVISFHQLPQGSTPTTAQTTALMHQESQRLKTIYVRHSSAYRQNVQLYRTALSKADQSRHLSAQLTHFQVVSWTLSSRSASIEWQARERVTGTEKHSSSNTWTTPVVHRFRLEGTTILTRQHGRWRVSSTAQTTLPSPVS